jgi:hypothetical protein
LSSGAAHARATCVFPGVATKESGADEVVNGVTVTAPVGKPLPAPLIALTRKYVVVPLAKPVTLYEVNELPVLEVTTIHVFPSSDFSTK